VATFYHLFMLSPKGRHACVVCTGTACYIKGASGLIDAVQRRLGVSPGQTTTDDRLSMLTARCVGACGLAPAVVLDGAVLGKQAAADLLARIEELA
jgi:bidirectional [NiFe] hydrogenase diaphorase subunit